MRTFTFSRYFAQALEFIKKNLSNLNNEVGNPETNVIAHLNFSHKITNVSQLFKKNPANVIWVNVGNCPLLVKILISEGSISKILNPGYGIVLGKRKKSTLVKKK